MTRSHSDLRCALPRQLALNGLAAAIALALAGCGGSGGDEAVKEEPTVISGVAATGAPLAGAKVTMTDTAGKQVCDTSADGDGAYRCTLPGDAAAPFALKASTADHTLYSSAPAAQTGTINLTPLTTLMVAKLAPNGNPAEFAAAMRDDPQLPAKIEAVADEVRKLIAPLQAAAGSAGVDPLRGSFKADGSGHDKVLDSLQVSIRPEANSSNIEVTMKVAPASDSAAPVSVSFNSSEAVPSAPPALGQLKAEDLVPDGMARRVADFTSRMTACYALPLAQRVSGAAEGATIVHGGPAAVLAPQCKGLFFDDDPAKFKDNGAIVSSYGSYAGIYSAGHNGVRFDMGNFEYQQANGDVLVSFRATAPDGRTSHYTATLRAQDGRLKAIGNQYDYNASVLPVAMKRTLPRQPTYDYLTSGYNVYIDNKLDAQRQPLFKEARVSTADGRQWTYRPQIGRSSLALVRGNEALTGTSIEYHAAAFVDPNTAGNPADKDTRQVFAAQQLSDEQIRRLPDQGVWTIEWLHRDESRPNVRQSYRTIARAPTLGELRQTPFAEVSPALLAEWMERSDMKTQGRLVFGEPSATQPNVFKLQTADGANGWLVPDGAIAPVSIVIYSSNAQGQSFNDGIGVDTLARKTTVTCSPQAAGDSHCDDGTGTLQFAAGIGVGGIELYGRTLRQVGRSSIVSFRLLSN